jgi:hypothetical protein
VFDFNKILNWKLLAGSHEFPGPDGGTCINEAAIVAAGFAYREIGSPDDCPPCFSRTLAAYALSLNDRIPDDALRHKLLMPFVTRLAGSADTEAVEELRAAHIIGAIVTRILPAALEFSGLFNVALVLRGADTAENTRTVMAITVDVIEKMVPVSPCLSSLFDDPLMLLADALRDLFVDEAWGRTQPMLRAGDLVYYAGTILEGKRNGKAKKAEEVQSCFIAAAAILEEAMAIGNQAESIATETVASRFETAKEARRQPRETKVLVPLAAA